MSELNYALNPTSFSLSGTGEAVCDIIFRTVLRSGWRIVSILLDQSQESGTTYYKKFAAIMLQLSHNYPAISVSVINFNSKNISTTVAALTSLQRQGRGIVTIVDCVFQWVHKFPYVYSAVAIVMTRTFVVFEVLVRLKVYEITSHETRLCTEKFPHGDVLPSTASRKA